jgi:hypothetical protein
MTSPDAWRTLAPDGQKVSYVLALTDEQWAAWNVASFMGEAQVGGARLRPFVVTPYQASVEYLKSQSTLRAGRWCPPGDYISLDLLRGEAKPAFDDESEWYTMMSDTPDEANDHAQVVAALWNLGGDVLIHGLGLGCVLSCALASPTVDHVDVVEVNADVIALVSPYYQQAIDKGRLTIHHDDCATKVWPRGSYWNVVWHDIWSSISDGNLVSDEEAEWGISYATMHRKFGRRCDWQGSWAFDQARWMRDVDRRAHLRAEKFAREWNGWSVDQRREVYLKLSQPPPILGAGEVPLDKWREMQDASGLGEQREKLVRMEITATDAYVMHMGREGL